MHLVLYYFAIEIYYDLTYYYTKSQITSSYLVEDKEYLLEFNGGEDEGVEINNLQPYKSLDFKLYIDREKYKNINIITNNS